MYIPGYGPGLHLPLIAAPGHLSKHDGDGVLIIYCRASLINSL